MKFRLSTLCLLFTSFLSSPAFSQIPAYQWAGAFLPTSPVVKGVSIPEKVAVDASGNVFTVGAFQGTVDFDPGIGIASLTSVGLYNIFVCKLDAHGNYVWAKSMGGSSTAGDFGFSLAVDGSSNVYLTGTFNGTADFDPGAGVANLTSNGQNDIFIAKLDANGNYVWAKSMGAAHSDVGNDIALDGSGNVCVIGYFQDTVDFDPGPGSANLNGLGAEDIFICKLDANGGYLWADAIASSASEFGTALAIDASGNIYLTGEFQGTVDFDPGSGTANLTSNGNFDLFVSKLDANGAYVWAKSMGNNLADFGSSIAVDGGSNVYSTGVFQATVDFDPGPGVANLTSNGGYDIYVSKLDASGNYVWARSMGSPVDENPTGIALDAYGSAYTTGYFQQTVDFDPGAGVANVTSNGDADIFVSKLDASGNYKWAYGIGDVNFDIARAITLDKNGNICATGSFNGIVDFDPGTPAAILNSGLDGSGFVFGWSQANLAVAGASRTQQLSVFPNPTTGTFAVRLPENRTDASILITDVAGRTVATKTISKDAPPIITFDLSDQAKGIYLVEVKNGNFSAHAKVVIE
jgi:hypothetical protein